MYYYRINPQITRAETHDFSTSSLKFLSKRFGHTLRRSDLLEHVLLGLSDLLFVQRITLHGLWADLDRKKTDLIVEVSRLIYYFPAVWRSLKVPPRAIRGTLVFAHFFGLEVAPHVICGLIRYIVMMHSITSITIVVYVPYPTIEFELFTTFTVEFIFKWN